MEAEIFEVVDRVMFSLIGIEVALVEFATDGMVSFAAKTSKDGGSAIDRRGARASKPKVTNENMATDMQTALSGWT